MFLSSGAAAASMWSEFKQELEGVDAVVNQESALILLSQVLQKLSLQSVKSLLLEAAPLQWNIPAQKQLPHCWAALPAPFKNITSILARIPGTGLRKWMV